jgi:glycosyl transferase family 25
VAKDWDIIRLSNATKSVFKPVAQLGGARELVRYWTVPNNTGAYLISRTGAIKFANAFDRCTLPVDEALRRPWQSGIVTFGVLPHPVEPDVLEHSSIDSTGRDRKLSARARFKDAAPWRDAVSQFNYRLETFGALDFARGLAQSLAASAVKQIRGRKAAAKLYRL